MNQYNNIFFTPTSQTLATKRNSTIITLKEFCQGCYDYHKNGLVFICEAVGAWLNPDELVHVSPEMKSLIAHGDYEITFPLAIFNKNTVYVSLFDLKKLHDHPTLNLKLLAPIDWKQTIVPDCKGLSIL